MDDLAQIQMPDGVMIKPRCRVVLVHATAVAIDPISRSFSAIWPEAETVNLLDDSLSSDLTRAGSVNREIRDRIASLVAYGRDIGADAMLFTCSAFGSAIERAASVSDFPVMKPNQAMFEIAIKTGNNVAMIATFPDAKDEMESEFYAQARRAGSTAEITTFLVPDALAALRRGDEGRHNHLIAEKAKELSAYDVIMLAQFSMARSYDETRARVSIPVLTSPDSAVNKLRNQFLK